jgi:glycosyltransferase involved in cell wall biosynthesis
VERKNPLISVIMSVYNGERYLNEAIDSILSQTYRNFEFIIINDGSTDRTKDILNSYNDKRLRIIHQPNYGVSESKNRAIKLSKGIYLAIQDADDISLENRLEIQVGFLESHPEIAAVASFNEQIYPHRPRFIQTNIWPTKPDRETLLQGNCMCHGSTMFRRSVFDIIGMYDVSLKWAHDYDLFLRISERFKLAIIPQVLYKLRMHPNSLSRTSEVCDYERELVRARYSRKDPRGK